MIILRCVVHKLCVAKIEYLMVYLSQVFGTLFQYFIFHFASIHLKDQLIGIDNIQKSLSILIINKNDSLCLSYSRALIGYVSQIMAWIQFLQKFRFQLKMPLKTYHIQQLVETLNHSLRRSHAPQSKHGQCYPPHRPQFFPRLRGHLS